MLETWPFLVVCKVSRNTLEWGLGSWKEGVTPKAVSVAASLYQFCLDHVTKTSLLLIRLKAECIIHQNVVLTSKTPGKSMSCVGQSSASGLAGTEDFFGRRLCDRWIKCCCYLSTKFALLLTKELAFHVLWSSIPHQNQRIWLWFSPSVLLLKVISSCLKRHLCR